MRKADEALQQLRKIMSKLKLTVNDEKTRICKVPEEEFDFLGYTFGRPHRQRRSRRAVVAFAGNAQCGLRVILEKIRVLLRLRNALTLPGRNPALI